MVILDCVSGVAWISTGTRSPASRNVSAIARSSPKLGSVTITPSIASPFDLNSAAHRFASSYVSTAPCLLCSDSSTTTSMPAFCNTAVISSRPDFARCAGKNPRLPTITPIVIFLLFAMVRYEFPLSCASRSGANEPHNLCQLLVPLSRLKVGLQTATTKHFCHRILHLKPCQQSYVSRVVSRLTSRSPAVARSTPSCRACAESAGRAASCLRSRRPHLTQRLNTPAARRFRASRRFRRPCAHPVPRQTGHDLEQALPESQADQ